MNILLLGINARYTHTNLALRYLREVLRQEGRSPVLQEYYINQPLVEMIDGVVAFRPTVIFFSAYIWNSKLLQDLLPDLKSLLPSCRFFIGGPEASYQGDFWLQVCPSLDLVISGPGEAAVQALSRVDFDPDRLGLPSKILTSQPLPLASLPFPYQRSEKESLKGRYLYYESSRGCPFSCAYCLSGRKDQVLEFRPVDQTLEHLAFLSSWAPEWPNTLLVKFVDRTFNAHKTRARTLWKTLGEWETAARFHFEVHPALLEAEDLEVLSRIPSGRFQFEIGVQSTTPKTLEAVGRSTGWADMKPRVKELIALGNIPVHLDLIAGLPGEGVPDVAQALDELYDLRPDHIQLGFLKNLPGSPLADQDLGLVCQHRAPYQVLETPWMSREDFARLRRWEELLEGIYNNPKTPGLMETAVERYGGFSRALEGLSEKAKVLDYDITTRNPEKVKVFVESS